MIERPRPARLAVAAVVLAVLFWGVGPVLVKLCSAGGLVLTLYRSWLGALVMVAALYATGGRLSRRIVRHSAVGGVLFGINIAFFFSAVRLTSVANATLITALQPALVLTVAGPWFGEKVGRREVGWTGASLAGIAIVVVGSAGAPVWSPLGDAMALAALVTWTGYFLVTKRARDHVGTLEYLAGMMLVAAVVVTPAALVSGQDLGGVGGADWLWLALMVLVPGAAGHALMSWAHPHVDVSVSSLIVVGVPVVSVLGGVVFLDEPLRLAQLVGGALCLIAVGAVVRRPQARAEEAGVWVATEPDTAAIR